MGKLKCFYLEKIFTLVFLKVLFLDLMYFLIYRTYFPDRIESICEIFPDDTSLFSIFNNDTASKYFEQKFRVNAKVWNLQLKILFNQIIVRK